jgi:hypothetical protein
MSATGFVTPIIKSHAKEFSTIDIDDLARARRTQSVSPPALLTELEDLAADLAVDIRFEELESAGGLCRYGGRTCLLVNRRLSVLERVDLISTELASLPLEDIFIRPRLRELLESRSPG